MQITVSEKASEIVSFRTLAITVLEVLGISLIHGFFLIHLIPGILLRETDLKLHEKILLSRKYFKNPIQGLELFFLMHSPLATCSNLN